MKTHEVYVLVKLDCSKEVQEMTDKVAGRCYTMDGIENTTATLMTGESLAVIKQIEAKKERRNVHNA